MRSHQRSPTTPATSEIAKLLQRIDDENQAAQRALYSLSSGTVRHKVISTHMERTQDAASRLIEMLGQDQAMPLIIKAMDQ